MRKIEIHSKSVPKILRGEIELSKNDLVEEPKGLTPGEWVIFFNQAAGLYFIGYANPYAESFFNYKLIKQLDTKFNSLAFSEEFVKQVIKEKIERAVDKRNLFHGYEEGARLIYGIADEIPGIIVDKYKKYILVQINTAGLDKYREFIKETLKTSFPELNVLFWDNEEYRKIEVLPIYPRDELAEDLELTENGISYSISKKAIQKIGYYYDHRENRLKLRRLIERYKGQKRNGLDLFSYVGSWGLHLLSAGIEKVEFVDQGDMGTAIETNLKLNHYLNRGIFYRADVFKFLDEKISNQIQYDVVVSDPPAFSKSEKNKTNALTGYDKLHLKALKVTKNKGIFVAASCTHHISHEELDKSVQAAATKNRMKLSLVDVGIQGMDHPMKSLADKSFYIKYLAYIVERGENEQ